LLDKCILAPHLHVSTAATFSTRASWHSASTRIYFAAPLASLPRQKIAVRLLPLVWTNKDGPVLSRAERCPVLPGVESSTRAVPPTVRLGPGLYRARQIVEGARFFSGCAQPLGNEVARLTRRYGSPFLSRMRVVRLFRHLILARKSGGVSGCFGFSRGVFVAFERRSPVGIRPTCGAVRASCFLWKLGAPCRMATIHSTSLASEQFVLCSIDQRAFRHFLRTPPRAPDF